MRITDAAKDGLPLALSSEAFSRIAQAVDAPPVEQEQPVEEPLAPVAGDDNVDLGPDFKSAQAKVASLGYKPIGSLMYKKAHRIWTMEHSPNGFALVRMAAEPAEFPEQDGESHEAPDTLHPEEKQAQFDEDEEDEGATDPDACPQCGSVPGSGATRGCPGCDPKLLYGYDVPDSAYKKASVQYRDRYGVQLKVGQKVSYTLGGDYVTGRVERVYDGYADVRLANQMDEGVPHEMLVVKRASDDMETNPLEDPDGVPDDMSMHKSLSAGRMILAFATWGAHIADQVVDAPGLTPRLKTAMLQAVPEQHRSMKRIASREALVKHAGAAKESAVRRIVLEGIKVRKLAKKNNLPFLLQWHLRNDDSPKARFKAIKAYRAGALPEQKILKQAVDSVAENYWEQYFGEYGRIWVQDVKRRIKADYVAEKLRRQGVDNKAVDYWSNYYGDYGGKLVDEVSRSLDEKPKASGKKTAAPYGVDAPPMPLPQPVNRRDIFAGKTFLFDESLGNNRVALQRVENGFNLLVRVANAQKGQFIRSKDEALGAFAREVKAHITG